MDLAPQLMTWPPLHSIPFLEDGDSNNFITFMQNCSEDYVNWCMQGA